MITSTANPRVKAIAALARRKHRDAEGRYLVEGTRAVADLLDTGDVEEVLAVPDLDRALCERVEAAGVTLTTVTEAVLAKVADAATPQGVVAVVRQRRAALGDVVGRGFLVVLHEVADPGNAGTAIRTATAAGAAGVVLTAGSVDPWNPKAVRASAGTVARQAVVVGVGVAEVTAACRAAEQRVVALDAGGARTIHDRDVLASPVALLFGNEAHGLPADVLVEVDEVVAVPMVGPVGSLNLAATVAVAAYAAATAGAVPEGGAP